MTGRTMRGVRTVAWLAASGVALATLPARAAGGLATGEDVVWPTWQARLSMTASAAAPVWSASLADARRVRQASLLGDVYVGQRWFGASADWRGGLRATGGFVMGPLGPAVAAGLGPTAVNLWSLTEPVYDAVGSTPPLRSYVGVGYAGLSVRGGWGLSADLGLLAGEPGALFGSDALLLRRTDLQPVVRFGVSLAF
jgi:hypothetical protein